MNFQYRFAASPKSNCVHICVFIAWRLSQHWLQWPCLMLVLLHQIYKRMHLMSANCDNLSAYNSVVSANCSTCTSKYICLGAHKVEKLGLWFCLVMLGGLVLHQQLILRMSKCGCTDSFHKDGSHG